jgi:hypothetical protein
MNTLYFTFYASITLIMTLYFDLVGKNYLAIGILAFVLTSIGYLGTLYTLESPIWLLKGGKVREARTVLQKISAFNGVNCDKEIETLCSSALFEQTT